MYIYRPAYGHLDFLVYVYYHTFFIPAGDVDSSVVQVVFTPTSGMTLPCPIPLVDDSIVEDDETFQLSLSLANPAQGSISTSTTQPGVATATIIDDGKCNSEN